MLKEVLIYLLLMVLCICECSPNEVGKEHEAEQLKCQKSVLEDCTEIRDCATSPPPSGVYTIQPLTYPQPFYVYCDMDTDGGGWTVFQKRRDGTVGFYRTWSEYKHGFGSINSEYWLGNDKIFYLTSQGRYKMRVDMSDFEGASRYAEYSSFVLGDEGNKYKLFLGSYRGNAGDSLGSHDGMYFSTKDRDNDQTTENCSTKFKGAWWYTYCHSSNLNGLYHAGTHSSYADGVNWSAWHGQYYSLKTTEMKIKRM